MTLVITAKYYDCLVLGYEGQAVFVCLYICSDIDKTWKDDVSWQRAVIFKATLSYIS